MKNYMFRRFKTHLFLQINSFLVLLCIGGTTLTAQNKVFQLAPLFQDNMVLQRQTNCTIWGKGVPQTNVVIRTSWGKQVNAG